VSPPTNLPAGSPAGQPALKPPPFVPGRDVQWTIPKLDGESRATVTLVLAVKALPPTERSC
jgi:hypothetical protein